MKKATTKTGVTSAYKKMTDKAGLVGSFLGRDAIDLDACVTHKALDWLLLKIAE